MEKWVAYPMHEVSVLQKYGHGVRQTSQRSLMESFPHSVLSQRKMVWVMILAWLIFLGTLLVLFAFGEVEAAEFTEKMVLVEVDGNVQLAMLALDEKAMARAAELGCLKGKLRKKQITFDFTDPVLPTLYVVYVCGEIQTKTKQ